MNLSPGFIGLYWLLASFAATLLWVAACEIGRATTRTAALAAHRAGHAACPCGAHQ